MSGKQSGQAVLVEGYYTQRISFYEQAIETEPDIMSHYWHLGLACLLDGQEEAAEATWLLVMSQGTPEDMGQWVVELIQILDIEAQRQADLNNTQIAWLIRQHLRFVAPAEINNLLHLLLLSLTLGSFTLELLKDWQVMEFLEQSSPEAVNADLLLQVLKQLLEFPSEETLAFIPVCLAHAHPSEIFISTVVSFAVKVAHQQQRQNFAAKLSELCLKVYPEHPGALQHLSCFYTNGGYYQQGIETAKRFYNNCQAIDWKILGNYLILRALLSAGSWLEVGKLLNDMNCSCYSSLRKKQKI